MGHMVERAQIVVKGIVQGVGFRPFVHNLAASLNLTGYITNTSEGVFIDIEGSTVPEFVERLRDEAPPLSRITDVSLTHLPVQGLFSSFTINESAFIAADRHFTLVPPDVSICDDCLRELFDPSDRRHLYPFINCTNCGPRYSITTSTPYDRQNTTMADFTMCPDCLREYHDPVNRRFHAQPNACAACGPHVEFKVAAGFSLRNESGVRNSECGAKSGEALQEAIKLLKNGGIVAVKGLGGFHIACDAANDIAVKRLRKNKRRSNKPFAVMAPDIDGIRRFCDVSEIERTVLLSKRRPIVLLRKLTGHIISDAVSPDNRYIGCMLPYTPLHYLLFRHSLEDGADREKPHFRALVMTSGNLSEEPIVHDNPEAVSKLSEIVDGFLFHDRDIFMRLDDSVVRLTSIVSYPSSIFFIRRSRGYAPDPIALHDDGPEVLGCGADQKNTFTLTKGRFAIPSQHIGDMENYETVRFFEDCLANLKSVYRVEPVAIAHDLHPGYLSTAWALDAGAKGLDPEAGYRLETFAVQHHYAHIGSVMAEHGLRGPVIGVAFDGTGYGADGNLWGGEFLMADIDGFERAGHLKYIPLPGGEAAIREPWKTAVSYIMDSAGDRAMEHLKCLGFIQKYGRETIEQHMIIARAREFSPFSSGAGRLFDAVSALLGVCDRNTFEGEAAMALEAVADEQTDDEYPVEFKKRNGYTVVDFSPAIAGIVHDIGRSVAKKICASKFHNTVASVIGTMVRNLSGQFGLKDVALSGGTFQNLYLLNRTTKILSLDGLSVYTNHHVPCNDGGISLGQAYLVRERLGKCGI